MTYTEVEEAEEKAGTRGGKLDRARLVFYKWQEKEGEAATKMTVLHALKECTLVDTMQKMQKEWGIDLVTK